MRKSKPIYNPGEAGDPGQEAFWRSEPSISQLVSNLGPLMATLDPDKELLAKIDQLPDFLKSSPFSMALAEDLLNKHPNMSLQTLEEILRAI